MRPEFAKAMKHILRKTLGVLISQINEIYFVFHYVVPITVTALKCMHRLLDYRGTGLMDFGELPASTPRRTTPHHTAAISVSARAYHC